MYDACSDCVVIVVLGDLVAWRHFVRGLEGAAQLFIIKLIINKTYKGFQGFCKLLEIKGQTR